MKLMEWIEREGISPETFARELGVASNMPARWGRGERTPRRETMCAIYLKTGGAVTPNDFYDLPALPAAEAAE